VKLDEMPEVREVVVMTARAIDHATRPLFPFGPRADSVEPLLLSLVQIAISAALEKRTNSLG
jgi:hypothetical protein